MLIVVYPKIIQIFKPSDFLIIKIYFCSFLKLFKP